MTSKKYLFVVYLLVFSLAFLLEALKQAFFSPVAIYLALPFIALFCINFFALEEKKPLAASFLFGLLIDVYSPLPLLCFALTFLAIAFLLKIQARFFVGLTLFSFLASFSLAFLAFQLFPFIMRHIAISFFQANLTVALNFKNLVFTFLGNFGLALIIFLIYVIGKNQTT